VTRLVHGVSLRTFVKKSKQSAAGVHQTSAASNELSCLAVELNALVKHFQI
jgi:methyl-accepting chemotaxis protein